MQTTFGVNMVALVDNVPRTLPLRSVIHNYVQHQREVIVRRAKHELRTLEAQVHRLEGLLIALDNLDAVIALIRALARPRRRARRPDRALRADRDPGAGDPRAAPAAADRARGRHDQARARRQGRADRASCASCSATRTRCSRLIKEELPEIAERYGDERRTQIAPAEDEIDIEDLIADQQMVITITKSGYIKSLPLATYRQQRRGGVGVTGMDMKDGDYIEHLFVCSTHDYLLFFTNRGKVYRSKVYELPEAGRAAKGRYLGNVLPLREGERVQSVLATRDFAEAEYLLFAHAQRRRQEDRVAGLQHADQGRRHHRDQHPRRRRARRRAPRRRGRRGPDGLAAPASPSASARTTRASMGRDTSGVRGMDVGARATRCSRWTSRATTRTCSS